MSYVAADVNGYLGDVASNGGWAAFSRFAHSVVGRPEVSAFAETGVSTEPAQLAEELSGLFAAPDINSIRATLIEYARMADDVLIVSDGTSDVIEPEYFMSDLPATVDLEGTSEGAYKAWESRHANDDPISPEKVTSTSTAELGGGTNESFILTTDDERVGVFKPVMGETLIEKSISNHEASLAEREVIAYRLDEALGLNLVPKTELIETEWDGEHKPHNWTDLDESKQDEIKDKWLQEKLSDGDIESDFDHDAWMADHIEHEEVVDEAKAPFLKNAKDERGLNIDPDSITTVKAYAGDKYPVVDDAKLTKDGGKPLSPEERNSARRGFEDAAYDAYGRVEDIKRESSSYFRAEEEGIQKAGAKAWDKLGDRTRFDYGELQYMFDDAGEWGTHSGIGSFQEFIEQGNKTTAKARDMAKMGVFDAIIGNVDRHRGNYIVAHDGSLKAIDHGFAFGTNTVTKAVDVLTEVPIRSFALKQIKETDLSLDESVKMADKIDAVKWDKVWAGSHLNAAEKGALLERAAFVSKKLRNGEAHEIKDGFTLAD